MKTPMSDGELLSLFYSNKEKLGLITKDDIKEVVEEALEKAHKKPEYIDFLIDKVLLYPDGKRVIKSLDDVATNLVDHVNKQATNEPKGFISQKVIKIDWHFLQETFFQPNGRKYSEKACRDAVRMTNY
jgi:predicted oxidoreductase (fatty acid repression mutant protein)